MYISGQDCKTYISMQDLEHFIIFCLILAVGAVLIIALLNVVKLVKRLNKIVIENQENINKTLIAVPELVTSVNGVANLAKENLDKTSQIIGHVENKICNCDCDEPGGIEGIIIRVQKISEVVKTVTGFISSLFKKENN